MTVGVCLIGMVCTGIALMLLAIRRLSRDVMDAWVLFAFGVLLLIVAWRIYAAHVLTIDGLEYERIYLTLLKGGWIL